MSSCCRSEPLWLGFSVGAEWEVCGFEWAESAGLGWDSTNSCRGWVLGERDIE